jgi:hypothetical protein
MSLCYGVETSIKVGSISFFESRPIKRVCIVVLVDIAGCKDSAMNALLRVLICKIESPDYIGADGLRLIILTLIDIWSAGIAGSVQNVRWLNPAEFFGYIDTVLYADCCGENLFTLVLKEFFQKTGDPAVASLNEKAVGYRTMHPVRRNCNSSGHFAG